MSCSETNCTERRLRSFILAGKAAGGKITAWVLNYICLLCVSGHTRHGNVLKPNCAHNTGTVRSECVCLYGEYHRSLVVW